jgi:hypothetical protein
MYSVDRRKPFPEKGHELIAADEEQLAGVARHGTRGAPLAVEQGDFAEKLSRAKYVEDQLLAVDGVHGEGNATRQYAVEAVAGIALLEKYAAGRNAPVTCAHPQLFHIPRRQCGEERMEAEQVLRRHSNDTVRPGELPVVWPFAATRTSAQWHCARG